ncbi:glucose dehydrogenase [FAD, quinone]-like [Maniola hyperantus]|uniref:glucose dehydrogenase [FAD, quinone]-like n=1 Tax=Aphantopus hyperantus TaxID=2795564 RepID=UPI001569A5DC|nr:glucose dehydrogenase [FAD, quinone]-like [Maniola hyperantus]
MATHGSFSFKPIISNTRILFGLLPGLGSLILLRMVIHLYRPDIEDAENRVRDHPLDELYDYYDFIVIGAGSAGAVVASRLSENLDWNILLVEAGQDENVLSDLPILFPVLQTSSIDWQFVTEPSSDYCLSMLDNRCKWPRGKVLGGSSALNAMLYVRGNKKDYDGWESLGNEGWGYKDILKYFLKAEDMRIPEYQSDPYHSTGGPISIEYFKFEQPITNKILQAGQQLGYSIVDVNGEFQTGFTKSHATLNDGLRCSTAKGYLRSASKRRNLHVSVHSLVEKVLIDEYNKAYGIKFMKHGKSKIIKSIKEVILSAGAIQSPQLLMLSGVGDSEQLKELGIFPVTHLPGVGKNLQDHIAMGGHSFLFDNPYTNGSDYSFNLNTIMSIGSIIDFALNKNGPLYSMMEAEAMAFVSSKYQDPAEDYPDIQLFIAPTADNMDGGIFGKRANGLSDETYAELYEDILYQPSFSIVPLLLRPKSRGYIKLRDGNPYSPPLIYPNYYSHPDDMLRMIDGARIAQSLIDQPTLKELNARPNPNRNPGCAEHDLMSDKHLECQARHHSLTIYHPVGTCAMGPANNYNAVVDPRLRVYGIQNLRVIDGSIMPTIVNGNTNAPIIMIAEKASDMIKDDWAAYSKYHEQPLVKPIDVTNLNYMQYKNAEEIASKPDIFTEVTKLFPYLSTDVAHKFDKSKQETNLLDKRKENFKNRSLDHEKLFLYTKNITRPEKSYYTPTFNNFLSNDYHNNDAARFRSYPYSQTKNRAEESSVKMLRQQKQNIFNHLANPSHVHSILSDRHAITKEKQFNKELNPARINQNRLTQNKQQTNRFYMTDRSIVNENRDCRLWLYYNGVKYEIDI